MTEREIFLALLDLSDAADRAAFLEKACEGDAVLRGRVEVLLQSHDAAGSFLGKAAQPSARLDSRSTQPLDGNAVPHQGHEADTEDFSYLAASTHPDSLGRIGHYEVLQVIGKGGFGIVFRAFDDVLHRIVAVKVMSPHLATTSPARRRFLREARSSAQVRHENVVQVYEVGEQPLPYIAMEFIPGETLQQRLDRIGPLDATEVVRIGRQIAEGLAAAHATDLIHRDIKPGNVLLEGGGQRAKITDFGLARTADDASISQSGMIAGTPMYMAPEQAKGETLDQRADLFSLGSVLYQMASGRPPFRANGTLAVMMRVAEDKPRPIREIIPETPQWLCDIISKLHAAKPEDRFQSAREVADVLSDCETQLRENAKLKDFSRIPRSKPVWNGRGKRMAAAAALLLPAVVLAVTELGGLTQLFRGRQASSDTNVPSNNPPVTPVESDATQRLLADAVLLMNFEKDSFYEKDGAICVRDLSGRGNDGVCEGASYTHDGKAGGGLACQGGGLRIPNSLIKGQANYTVTGWCRWDAISPPSGHHHYRTVSKRREGLFGIGVPPERSVHVSAWNQDYAPPEHWFGGATPAGVVPKQGWYFFAVTMKDGGVGKGTVRVTVDDVAFALNCQMLKAGDGAEASDLIGSGMTGAVIDEVTVFHRALSDYEISALRELGQKNVPLPPTSFPPITDGWVSLFNGKNLDGWTGDRRLWAVENGQLVTRIPKDATPRYVNLSTVRNDYRDFRVRLEGKINDGGDSGLLFRGRTGLQAQIKPGDTVGLLDSTKSLAIAKRGILPNQWFAMEVIANGPHITVRVDGEDSAEWTDPIWVDRSGVIALETGFPSTEFFVRKIEVKELPAAGAPSSEAPPPHSFKNSIGMDFVIVPKGKSLLGGGKGKMSDREVAIPTDFYLGKYEVTQEEWEKVMGENPSAFSRAGKNKEVVQGIPDADLKRFPVEQVSWSDAQLFLTKLNQRAKEPGWVYRLPTEAEWEYACRGGPHADKLESSFAYYLTKPSNELLPEQANFKHDNGLNRPTKVGSYPPNRLGLHDMHGNVWEWCDSIVGSTSAFRGGSWFDTAGACKASFRYATSQSDKWQHHGLRVARVPSDAPSSAAKTPSKDLDRRDVKQKQATD